METYRIDFTAMLIENGVSKKQAKKMVKEHDEKVRKSVESGNESYPVLIKSAKMRH